VAISLIVAEQLNKSVGEEERNDWLNEAMDLLYLSKIHSEIQELYRNIGNQLLGVPKVNYPVYLESSDQPIAFNHLWTSEPSPFVIACPVAF
jgi:hypothetical protein